MLRRRWIEAPFSIRDASAIAQRPLSTSDSVEVVLPQIDVWLDKFTAHLREAGLGQVSEIFDGDAPHAPRGCIAQAWSVAEILRLAKLVAKHPSRRRERGAIELQPAKQDMRSGFNLSK